MSDHPSADGMDELLPGERTLVLAMAAYDPALRHLIGEHVAYYEQVLPTLLLSEVGDWAKERFIAGEEGVVAGLLRLLEAHYVEGGMPVQNLIGTGFIEHMDPTYGPAAGMRDLLGPKLAASYRTANP